jgi:hypothetical protein
VYLIEGWYTVLVTDANGCTIQDSIFMDVLDLESTTQDLFLAYPNPTQGQLQFSQMLSNLEVLDNQGRRIRQTTNCSSMDLSDLSAGTYQFVYKANGNIQVVRIIKE